MTKVFVHLEEKWVERIWSEDQSHPWSTIIRGVHDQSEKDVGEILRLESSYQRPHWLPHWLLENSVYFMSDSIFIEVDCPCNLGLFWWLQAYVRVHLWYLFIECLLFTKNFMSISTFIFLSMFFISSTFTM